MAHPFPPECIHPVSGLVHNFAFGSNLSLDKMTSRGLKPLRARCAVLKGWKLRFSQLGFPPAEPSFANLERCGSEGGGAGGAVCDAAADTVGNFAGYAASGAVGYAACEYAGGGAVCPPLGGDVKGALSFTPTWDDVGTLLERARAAEAVRAEGAAYAGNKEDVGSCTHKDLLSKTSTVKSFDVADAILRKIGGKHGTTLVYLEPPDAIYHRCMGPNVVLCDDSFGVQRINIAYQDREQTRALADAVLGFNRAQAAALLGHMSSMARGTAEKTAGTEDAARCADLTAVAGLFDGLKARLAEGGVGALAAADVHALTFCQTWMDGRRKGLDAARFSVMCPHFQTTVTFGPGAAEHFDAEALRAHARLTAHMVDAMRVGYDQAFMFIGDAWAAQGAIGGLAGLLGVKAAPTAAATSSSLAASAEQKAAALEEACGDCIGEVHGVLYDLTPEDFAVLWHGEGAGQWYDTTRVDLQCYPPQNPKAREAYASANAASDGGAVGEDEAVSGAVVFSCLPARRVPGGGELPPSRRYLSLLTAGAADVGLAPAYQRRLARQPASPPPLAWVSAAFRYRLAGHLAMSRLAAAHPAAGGGAFGAILGLVERARAAATIAYQRFAVSVFNTRLEGLSCLALALSMETALGLALAVGGAAKRVMA